MRDLIQEPESSKNQEYLKITLENLDQIVDFCREKKVPVVLVIFPYRFQFKNIETLSGPQKKLVDYANQRQVPVLDLLPALSEKLKEDHLVPKDYILDADHPSAQGSKVIAQILADFIVKQEGVLGNKEEANSQEVKESSEAEFSE